MKLNRKHLSAWIALLSGVWLPVVGIGTGVVTVKVAYDRRAGAGRKLGTPPDARVLSATDLPGAAILPSTERRRLIPPADIQTPSNQLSAVKLGTVPPWRKMWASAYAKGCECSNPVRVRGKIVDCGKPLPPRPTKSGKWPEANWTIAAHPSDYPIGTVLELSYRGILTSRRVDDIGSDITRGRLDLYMADCRRADTWGRKQIDVREVRRSLAMTSETSREAEGGTR